MNNNKANSAGPTLNAINTFQFDSFCTEHPNINNRKAIDVILEQIRQKIDKADKFKNIYILDGRTGSGKSTLFIAELFKTFRKKILVAEPRIVLTRNNTFDIIRRYPIFSLAKNIGFKNSNENQTPEDEHSITFMTTQLLVNQLQTYYQFYSTITETIFIIIDEAHLLDIQTLDLLREVKRFVIKHGRDRLCPLFILQSATIRVKEVSKYYFPNLYNEFRSDWKSIGHVIGLSNFKVTEKFVDDYAMKNLIRYESENSTALAIASYYLRFKKQLIDDFYNGNSNRFVHLIFLPYIRGILEFANTIIKTLSAGFNESTHESNNKVIHENSNEATYNLTYRATYENSNEATYKDTYRATHKSDNENSYMTTKDFSTELFNKLFGSSINENELENDTSSNLENDTRDEFKDYYDESLDKKLINQLKRENNNDYIESTLEDYNEKNVVNNFRKFIRRSHAKSNEISNKSSYNDFHKNTYENSDENFNQAGRAIHLIKPNETIRDLDEWRYKNNRRRIILVPIARGYTSSACDSLIDNLNVPKDEHLESIIFIATNVIETGKTIKNLSFALDCGFDTVACFNPLMFNISKYSECIRQVPESKSKAIQRLGRVGREREGEFLHFMSEQTYNILDDYEPPDTINSYCISKQLLDISFHGYLWKQYDFEASNIYMIKFTSDILINSCADLIRAGFLTPFSEIVDFGIINYNFDYKFLYLIRWLHYIKHYKIEDAAYTAAVNEKDYNNYLMSDYRDYKFKRIEELPEDKLTADIVIQLRRAHNTLMKIKYDISYLIVKDLGTFETITNNS